MKIAEFTAQSFIFAIAHGYNTVWRKFNVKLTKSGCNMTEALVLIALFFEEGKRANPSALAQALRTSRGNISHCLSKLERHHFIKRELAEHDARHLTVSLQPAGSRLAQKLIFEIEKIEALCEQKLAGLGQKRLLEALFTLGDGHVPVP